MYIYNIFFKILMYFNDLEISINARNVHDLNEEEINKSLMYKFCFHNNL